MSPMGRDPEQRDPLRPSRESLRESLVERQIREGIESGAFDDLPHQGRRLPLVDDSAAGDWAMAHRMLRNAGAAPPWIEADKDVRALLERRDALIARAPLVGVSGPARLRRELADVVVAVNLAIERVNATAPTDRQHRRLLDPAEELASLEAALEGADRGTWPGGAPEP